jgi:hypothetical protein
MVDVNDLIDPLSGWELLDADDINDAGQIAGQGLIGGEYHAFLLTPIPPQSGDFNEDSIVDDADLIDWRGGFGTTDNASHAQGDTDADGDVDGADFLVWQRQLGGSPPATLAAAVPEPCAGLVIATAAPLAFSLRTRLKFTRPQAKLRLPWRRIAVTRLR